MTLNIELLKANTTLNLKSWIITGIHVPTKDETTTEKPKKFMYGKKKKQNKPGAQQQQQQKEEISQEESKEEPGNFTARYLWCQPFLKKLI